MDLWHDHIHKCNVPIRRQLRVCCPQNLVRPRIVEFIESTEDTLLSQTTGSMANVLVAISIVADPGKAVACTRDAEGWPLCESSNARLLNATEVSRLTQLSHKF